jgi:hypothetical protein
MESAASEVEVLASGDAQGFSSPEGDEPDLQFYGIPLMVSFVPIENGGKVLYTSFHNEAQVTEDMLCILKTIILSL